MKKIFIITKKDGDQFFIVAAFELIADAFERMDQILFNVLQDVPAPLALTVETIKVDGGIRFIKHGSKQWRINCQDLHGAK